MSDDTPVFTVTRNREMIQRAVERARTEEREKVAAALHVQANTVGGVIGAALHAVADQVTSGAPIAATVVGAAARRDLHDDGTDPPLSVPFEALTEPQRQRRLARYHAELAEANARQSAALKAENERIAREAAERARLRAVDPDADFDFGSEGLPPDRERDDADAARSLLGRRLPTPPGVE